MNKQNKTRLIQIGLFVATVIATTLAGAEWLFVKSLFFAREEYLMTWQDFIGGFEFSVPFLLILSCHEFGHYFTARYHNIKVTLPYYIPMWLGFMLAPSFGTMGAFIRIKDIIRSRKHYFDVGVSGPLAGFVIAIGVIAYGYTHLPAPEYIYDIHPDYEQFGLDYEDHVYSYEYARLQDSLNYLEYRTEDSLNFVQEGGEGTWGYREFEGMESYPSISFNKPLLYVLIEKYMDVEEARIPNKHEIMHNPYLLAGLLALFFTALNLLPIGQLDGGHIVFAVFGEQKGRKISAVLFTIFLFYAGLGFLEVSQMRESSDGGGVLTFLLILVGYLYYLYLCAYSMFESKKDRLTYAAVIMAAQFALHTFFGFTGYSGWLLFALLLGRFVGIYHPIVADNRPLSTSRKILAAIALIVFILSFSPEPFIFEV